MVTQAFRDKFYLPESDDDCACLLLIEGSTFDPLRLTNLMGPFDADSNTFVSIIAGQDWIWVPFDIEPPGEGPQRSRGRLSVPDITRRIGRAINLLSSRPSITITFVLRSDPTIIVRGPYGNLQLINFQGSHETSMIQADIIHKVLDTENFPKDRIEPRKYRAIARSMS